MWCEEEEEEEEGGGGERYRCGTLMSMETHIQQKKDLIMMATYMTIQICFVVIETTCTLQNQDGSPPS
jgi:hypothetical protein